MILSDEVEAVPWRPKRPRPAILFPKIADAARGWQYNPLQPLRVGGSLANVVVSQSPTISSSYSASELLNKAR